MGMKVSTKGRYALRVLTDLADMGNEDFVSLSEVAERQGISEKYLEAIIVPFSKKGYVKGCRGKGGGYKLVKDPAEFTVKEVLNLVEGDLAPVSCLGDDPKPCPNKETCKTLPMWEKFYDAINAFFEGITIEDLSKGNIDVKDL